MKSWVISFICVQGLNLAFCISLLILNTSVNICNIISEYIMRTWFKDHMQACCSEHTWEGRGGVGMLYTITSLSYIYTIHLSTFTPTRQPIFPPPCLWKSCHHCWEEEAGRRFHWVSWSNFFFWVFWSTYLQYLVNIIFLFILWSFIQ